MANLIQGLVSIVTPAYNSARFLPEMIASVVQQSYGEWELIIVDDNSSDTTLDLVNRYAAQESRIKVVVNSCNAGPAGARNVAIRAARGQYLAFLDSDDLWMPTKLEVQLAFMRRHAAGFSFTSYSHFSSGETCVLHPVPAMVDYHSLLRRNVIGCLTVVLDRNRIPEVSMPAVDYEDYAAWLRILRNGEIAYGIQQDLARYRLSSDSVSSKKLRSAAWVWRIYREKEQLSFVNCLWHFCWYGCRSITSWQLRRA